MDNNNEDTLYSSSSFFNFALPPLSPGTTSGCISICLSSGMVQLCWLAVPMGSNTVPVAATTTRCAGGAVPWPKCPTDVSWVACVSSFFYVQLHPRCWHQMAQTVAPFHQRPDIGKGVWSRPPHLHWRASLRFPKLLAFPDLAHVAWKFSCLSFRIAASLSPSTSASFAFNAMTSAQSGVGCTALRYGMRTEVGCALRIHFCHSLLRRGNELTALFHFDIDGWFLGRCPRFPEILLQSVRGKSWAI